MFLRCSHILRSLSCILPFLLLCTQTQSFLAVGSSPSPTFTIIANVLPLMASQSEGKNDETTSLKSKCACGKVNLQIRLPTDPEEDDLCVAVDCHCPKCRKYHVAAFASYLNVPSNRVSMGDSVEKHLKSYTETCDEVGPVERLFCRQCYTKVATKPISNEEAREENTNILVNMGGLVDKAIPVPYRNAWSKIRVPWQQSSQSSWADSKPEFTRRGMVEGTQWTSSTGSCACGKCQYRMGHVPDQMQHCYCRLCRQLSGSAFQTWIPADNRDFEWIGKEPTLQRTTEHGQRHVCSTCAAVLTIVYDDQPDITWPAAGGLDDGSLPPTREELDPYMERVCHICCKWKQSWYALPKDGLEKIKYAC